MGSKLFDEPVSHNRELARGGNLDLHRRDVTDQFQLSPGVEGVGQQHSEVTPE
jgi:hypothetical protein